MSDNTSIEWTRGDDGTPGATWNPVTGCEEVSEGCDNCYAKTFAERWRGIPGHHFENGFDITLRPERLHQPLRWKKPRRVFVNSMSDLFHKDVPSEFIAQVFAVMAQTPRHTYQILTKRHARMRHLVGGPIDGGCNLLEALTDEAEVLALYDALWPLTNVHLGVSVENQHWASIRIPALQQTQAETRFLSCEPLVGPIPELDLDGIDWVIIGGESGPRARTMDPDWAREIIGQCRAAAVPVFVKQMGTIWARSTKFNGMSVARLGDPKGGKTEWWPTDLQVQEFPQQPRAGAA